MADKPNLNVIQPPVCRHLLSKGMFITGLLNPADDPVAPMGDGYCWCNRNQRQFGPDGGVVDRETCTPSRSCFEFRL